MSCIGLIANPASGKDIRRLLSYATCIDNNEKINILKRIVSAAAGLGVKQFAFMPDTYMMGRSVLEALSEQKNFDAEMEILDFEIDASLKDTVRAAEIFRDRGFSVCVVLGGDGTSRATAKGIGSVPLLPVSTGTNNVYPRLLEGTVAGLAAAAVSMMENLSSCTLRDKLIEVSINGEVKDIALVDAVYSRDRFIGSRAILDIDKIKETIVTRAHPASIGFSAIAGVLGIIGPEDNSGLAMSLGPGGESVIAACSAGVVSKIEITKKRRLELGEVYSLAADCDGMIALDGERELYVKKGDFLEFKIKKEGPLRIIPERALEEAVKLGLFKQS